MTEDQDFETLMGMARDVVEKAGQNFDGGDLDSDRYTAFMAVCISEGARRVVERDIENVETIFTTYLEFSKAVQAGEQPPPPPIFNVIQGGKSEGEADGR